MLLKADLHVHTQNSLDSRTALEQAIEAAKRAGLDFLAVTDHDVPPPEEVFLRPDRDGLLLVPGVEYSTDKGHLLGLFLREPCPRLVGERPSFDRAAEIIHQCGGLAVMAHPFQSTAQTAEERFTMLKELEPLLDGVEVCNRRAAKKRRDANLLAQQAAEQFLKPCVCTAGSDAHLPEEIGTAFLTADCPEKSLDALRNALVSGAACSWQTQPCCNKYIAQSQKIKLEKTQAGPGAWARWSAFRVLCTLRDTRGAFQKG